MEDNIIKDMGNLFELKRKRKKEIDHTGIKDIRNVFRLKKKRIKQSKVFGILKI